MTASRTDSVIITGGGTAGHTNPGIAVGQALVDAGLPTSAVHFIGGVRGNEATLVAEAGFSIDLLSGRGIQRKLSPSAIKDNIGSIIGLTSGFIKGFAIVARRRPKAVVCLGGYAAFAASAAAVILRIPLVVTEQNARASAVNRLFGKRARVCALPFPDTDLPNGVLTGNPIRAGIIDAVNKADRDSARGRLEARYTEALGGPSFSGLGERVIVAVWAGSLGATKVNEAVQALAQRWQDRPDVLIHHVVGTRDWDRFGQSLNAGGASSTPASTNYVTVQYESAMPDILVGADIAVCRSGASTVTELAVAGLPSILVPLPTAPRDHQRANSAELAKAGGAIVIDNADLTGEYLAEVLEPLVDDHRSRQAMARAAASVARPDAAHEVAKLVLDVGGIA